MKQKILLIAVFVFCLQGMFSQPVRRALLRSQAFRFNHVIYVYGYQQNKADLIFKCYAYNAQLACKDSIDFNLGKHKPDDFLPVAGDTLHDVLNFYFQQADQKNTVTLLRTNHNLAKLCSAANVDANHVNTLTAFDDEQYVFKNSIYVIKTAKDSLKTQYFLSKYSVKSFAQPFDYDLKWQFPFERQFIHRASVIYADSSLVFVYTTVTDSAKKGQWILKLDARTGELLRGIRVNIKGDPRAFLYSNSLYDPKTRNLVCIGNTYSPKEINLKTGRADFSSSAKTHQFFVVKIDSMGNIVLRTEKSIPLPVTAGKMNEPVSYHCKVRDFQKAGDKSFGAWTDIYGLGIDGTAKYVSSWYVEVSESDMDFDLVPAKFYNNTAVLPGLVSKSKGDLYGKFLLDGKQYDKFLYKKPLMPVVVQTWNDALNNPVSVLVDTDISTGSKIYYLVSLGKKGLESKVILRSDKDSETCLFLVLPDSFISGISSPGAFELKMNRL